MGGVSPPPGYDPTERRLPDAVARNLLASLIFHAALMAGAIAWRASTPVLPPVEAEIPVELLTPGQYEAATAPEALPGTSAGDTVMPGPDRAAPPAMIRATRMLSASALADPLSRQAREMLPSFNGTERMVQLCNLEAMEQVHAWRPDIRPERIVAYAMAELSIKGETITADGAAFRSAGRWYNLRFACVLSPDHETVTSFAFRVGEEVPEDQWAAHNLLIND